MMAMRTKLDSVERSEGSERCLRGVRVVGTMKKNTTSLNVLLDIEGKMTFMLSPKRTMRARLGVSDGADGGGIRYVDAPIRE